jgi:EF-P beta-lysylation protein EpmB
MTAFESTQPHWISELKSMITDPADLCKRLELPNDCIASAIQGAQTFPLRVTNSFVSRMRKGDPKDPLLQQVLPLGIENTLVAGFSSDPLNETHYNPIPGLLHKYQGRVLITLHGSCAIHCRYCFRRHFPYSKNIPDSQLTQIIDYITQDDSIQEVILSGGDPLIIRDTHLERFIKKLETVSHIKILRIHTRLPIVLPSRITDALIRCLSNTRLKSVLIIHSNHPNEIDLFVGNNLLKLANAGVTLMNQTVLLKGINDAVEVLKQLSYTLFEYKVLPYYLHCLDKVQGAAHFDVSIEMARDLYRSLRDCLPGYLVPLLVQEKSGASAKVPVV